MDQSDQSHDGKRYIIYDVTIVQNNEVKFVWFPHLWTFTLTYKQTVVWFILNIKI